MYDLIDRFVPELRFRLLFNSDFPASAGASAGPIARMLPRIPALLEGAGRLRPGLVHEYRIIVERYREWLDRYGMFEPEWEEVPDLDASALIGRPTVVWPDLIDDFKEYEAWFARHGETISLRDSAVFPEFRVFSSYHDEIRQVFADIERDLDSGVALHEIAISVAGLDRLRPWIELESNRRGVPIRFAGGRAVAVSTGVRWLTRLEELVASDFSVVALAAVVLDRSVPWRSHRFLEQMIEFGYRSHAYSIADWEEAFALARRVAEGVTIGEVRITARAIEGWEDRFRRLCNGVRAIVGARSADALVRAINAFVRANFEPPESERWREKDDGAAEHRFEIAQAEAVRLRRFEAHGPPVARPWAVYLDLLRERLYVPQGNAGSIPVYPYRVAAGIPIAKHYVLNLSQGATRVRAVRPIGPRTEELRRMGWDDRDRSAAFISAYATAGASGALSCAIAGVDGAQVVAAEIVDRAEVKAGNISAPSDDLHTIEQRWWTGGGPKPTRMYRPQHDAIAHAVEAALTDPSPDFQRERVPGELLSAIDLEPFHLSPTTARTYATCPYSYLLSAVLSIGERDYGYRAGNPMVVGSTLHRALESVLSGGEGVERNAIVGEAFADPIVRLQVPRRAEAERIRWYQAILGEILSDDRLGLDRPGRSELELSWSGNGVALHGTADRVTGLDGGGPVTIVDFKLGSGSVPKHEEVASGREPQIPLYRLMVQQEYGVEVDRIAYVILKDASVRWIADREGTPRQRTTAERVDELIEKLPEYLAGVRARVAEGDFRCGEEDQCTRCGMRSICRRCYVTRRYGDGA